MRPNAEAEPVTYTEDDGAVWEKNCCDAQAPANAPVEKTAEPAKQGNERSDKSLDKLSDDCIKEIVNKGSITEEAFDAISKELREKDINRSELLSRIDTGLSQYGMHLELETKHSNLGNIYVSLVSIALKHDKSGEDNRRTVKTWPVCNIVTEFDTPIDDTPETHFIDYTFAGRAKRNSK